MRSFLLFSGLFFTLITLKAQYKVGDVVESFSGQSSKQVDVSLDDFAGKEGIVVVFTSHKCKEAHSYSKGILKEIHKKFSPQGYPVVAVDITATKEEESEDPTAALNEILAKDGINYLYVVDPEKELLSQFFGKSETYLPHAIVLKKSPLAGENVFKVFYTGAIDDSPVAAKTKYLEPAIIKAMHAEDAKSPSEAKEDEAADRKVAAATKKTSAVPIKKDKFVSTTKVTSRSCSSKRF